MRRMPSSGACAHACRHQRLFPVDLRAGDPEHAPMYPAPAPCREAVSDRFIGETGLVCLFCDEQPSLVDCEPSSNSVCIHGPCSELARRQRGKTLFVDAYPCLGRKSVQTSRSKES